MPSPFPGMDPYLENPGLWPDVHHEIISEARALLNDQVRPKYFVRIEERVYISPETDPGRSVIAPDLNITARPGWEGKPNWPRPAGGAEEAEPIEVVTLLDDEIREARLEIIDREGQSVVTVIE